MKQEYRKRVDTSGCHFCAKKRDIEVHHIVPQRFNGSDARENLVAVCDRCHNKLEALYDKRFYEQLGVSDESGERHVHYTCSWNCEKDAVAKIWNPRANTEWLCKEHAKELLENIPRCEIKKDLTDSLFDAVDQDNNTTTLH